jgi:hypothetical protein
MWQDFHDWLSSNRSAFWTAVGVATCVWAALTVWLSTQWLQRANGRVILGQPTRLKVLVGILSILLIVALTGGILNLVRGVGGFRVVAAWLICLAVGTLAAALLLISTVTLLRQRQLRLDPAARTWSLRRGWIFAPEARDGSYDEISHLQLEETKTWRWHIWRIALTWKDGADPYRILEYRLRRTTLPQYVFGFLTGTLGLLAQFEQRTRERAQRQLAQLGDELHLPSDPRVSPSENE